MVKLEIGKIITLTNNAKIIELDVAKKLYEYNGYKLEMLDWGYTFRVVGYADHKPANPLPFDELPKPEPLYYYYGHPIYHHSDLDRIYPELQIIPPHLRNSQ